MYPLAPPLTKHSLFEVPLSQTQNVSLEKSLVETYAKLNKLLEVLVEERKQREDERSQREGEIGKLTSR